MTHKCQEWRMFFFLFQTKSRFRRKMAQFDRVIAVSCVVMCLVASIVCTPDCSGSSCYNGKCIENETLCECFDGWIGSSCSDCSGRSRYTQLEGVITDGHGNYSEDNKCMWLIEPGPLSGPIIMDTNQFATECGWDHLYIFDGDSVFSPLIAAFSGLVIPEVDEHKSLRQVVAHSGKVYLYFYSDAAYNMSGFNVKYTVGGCPLNCSDHGECVGSICICEITHAGDYCEREKCPNACSGHGHCTNEICVCDSTHKGNDCSIPLEEESWISPSPAHLPDGRASAASVVIGDHMWVIGGYSFGKQVDFLIRFNLVTNTWSTVTPVSSDNPTILYGHSVVVYKNCLYVFGGVMGQHIESRLRMFNMTDSHWTYRDYNETVSLAGHTAVLVDHTMHIIFGHSPVYGYVNRVHEIDLDDANLTITSPETQGALVKGGYSHTSVYYEKTGEIFVKGGYHSGSTTQYSLTDELYSYNPLLRTWKILSPSGAPRYLHSAVMLGDLMLVFGGNPHNDTSISLGAKCYSLDFMAYDPECNAWHTIPPITIPESAARYGHTAQVVKQASGREMMYIFGGFTGVMLNDMLVYEPGSCSLYDNKTTCLAGYPGRECVWTKYMDCRDKKDAYAIEYESRQNCTPSQGADRYCRTYKTCGSCLSTMYGCKWCSNNNCSVTCSTSEKTLTGISQCPSSPDANERKARCHLHNNCDACHLDYGCLWGTDKQCTIRQPGPLNDKNTSTPECPISCYKHDICENCTQKGCMWCGSQQRCVETNSYVASFLYGQCMEWTTRESKCAATRCSDLHVCDECKSNPACGWCNHPSNTGLGKCIQGANSGPVRLDNITGSYDVDLGICPAERWHFIDCPLCQCNGHSSCLNVSNQCDQCTNLTTGEHCDACIEGFWGNPKNGGNCSECSCNGQADTCDGKDGTCFCRTRGVKGASCNECEPSYFGDPENNGTCYYDLRTDYQFTFNLSKPDDKYFHGINFMNIPTAADRDVDFTVNCSSGKAAFLNITVRSKSHPQEQFKVMEYHCTYFRAKFEHKEYNFGDDDNVTFLVYVYGFETPFWLQISFSQFPKIDLVHFFVTFFSCFLSLLIIAAVLYKIKHKYDSYRRRQRMIVEMEEMASRPFATSIIELERKPEVGLAEKKDLTLDLRKRKRVSTNKPSHIALEPLHNQKAAVLSLFIQLPTGESDWTPNGNSGLCIGSSLITLGHQRKQSLEHGKMDKNKHRKAFGHSDTCV